MTETTLLTAVGALAFLVVVSVFGISSNKEKELPTDESVVMQLAPPPTEEPVMTELPSTEGEKKLDDISEQVKELKSEQKELIEAVEQVTKEIRKDGVGER